MPGPGQRILDPSATDFALIAARLEAINQKVQQTAWDPWPVDKSKLKKNVIFSKANALLQQRNHESVDTLIDRIVLLPASSDPKYKFQGGSPGMLLYSVRSPSTLPVRIHLWATPAGKVMVRQRNTSISLDKFITSWTSTRDDSDGFCKQYHFWKSVSIDDQRLKDIPEHLRQQIHERWWAVNGFRFLELPFELRAMTLRFAMGFFATPYERSHEAPLIPLGDRPNMQLPLVSKQLYQEATAALHRHSTFSFRAESNLVRFFHYNKPLLMELWSLELSHDRNALLSLFGVGMEVVNRTCRFTLTRPRGGCMFVAIRAKLASLRRLRIIIPHITAGSPKAPRSACQKLYCMALWAGAREYLRQFPTIEFGGYVWCDIDKAFLAEHATERKGIIPDPDDFRNWQLGMLAEWYVYKIFLLSRNDMSSMSTKQNLALVRVVNVDRVAANTGCELLQILIT